MVAGVTTYLLSFRFAQDREREMVTRDRELAQVLAGLRNAEGRVDFDTLTSFVSSSDRVDTGLVYALVLDRSGAMLQGAINPRLFAKLDSSYQQAVNQGRRHVLEALAAGKLDRRGRIKEYQLPVPRGRLRLGFDLQRIDAQIARQGQVGLAILGAGLLLGIIGSVLLARRVARPIKHLASAMEAVAGGDMQQTVQVATSDEIASLAGSFNRMMRALRDAGGLQRTLEPYLGAAVLRRLLREERPLEMISEDRLTTVVSLALEQPPRTLAPRARLSLLNDYLAPVIDALHQHGGVILDLDCHRLRAAWNVPDDARQPQLEAIGGAVAARRAVEDEGRRQSLAGSRALSIQIGVSTGKLVAGNVGSMHRVSYGVLGDAAEIADQIIPLASPGEILASESTVAQIRDQITLASGPPLFIEGFDEAIPLYRVS